ncbi:competence protein ComK, partial [Bacillus sp. HC-Mk]
SFVWFSNRWICPISASNPAAYTFPTESPSSPNCIWLFYNHIHDIDFCQKIKKAKIHFSNGTTTTISISPHKLQQQLLKAGYILSRMNMQDSLQFKNPLLHLLH